jgi:hypothetical protein
VTSTPLRDALRDLQSALRPLDGTYMLFGGLAVVLRGFPRHTDDIDITILGSECSPLEAQGLLSEGGFEERLKGAVAFADQSQVLLMRHRETGIDLDVTFAWLPFESEAIHAAEPTDVDGINIPVATVEHLIIYKAVAWRERDKRDIGELWALHGAEVDRERILAVVAEFAEAIDEPERVAELGRVLAVR